MQPNPGNLTGVSIDAGYEIVAKRLQILKEVMPSAAKVAYLTSSRTLMGTTSLGLSLQKAAQALGIGLSWNFLPEVNDALLRRAFTELTSQQFDAAMVDASGSFLAQRTSIWGGMLATCGTGAVYKGATDGSPPSHGDDKWNQDAHRRGWFGPAGHHVPRVPRVLVFVAASGRCAG